MPASTAIFSNIFLLHRHEGLWGKDVNEFDPNRWLDERMDLVVKNPFIFLPFNAGPRVVSHPLSIEFWVRKFSLVCWTAICSERSLVLSRSLTSRIRLV